MLMGACPECDSDVPFSSEPMMGQRVLCRRCRAVLLVIGLTPIELDWAYIEPLRDLDHKGVDIRFDDRWQNEV
jgi:hypothetical protein